MAGGALITILTALVIAGVDGLRFEQSKITFAMADAVVDLAQVVNVRYGDATADERLSAQDLGSTA